MTEAEDVAQWMMEQLRENDTLHQREAVFEIEDLFGESFVYQNDRGHMAISPAVLSAFRKISGDDVVWSASGKHWRFREDWDEDGRKQ